MTLSCRRFNLSSESLYSLMCFIGGVNNLLPSDFQPFLVTAQSSLSYCLRVTAEGANQNAQRPFFNTGIILNNYILSYI